MLAIRVHALLIGAVMAAGLSLTVRAATENVLVNFGIAKGGCPYGQLVPEHGAFFGTGSGCSGGRRNGQIFRLKHSGSGWNLKRLAYFDGKDGNNPSAGLIRDATGSLYGTAYDGGGGAGTVFELAKSGSSWKLLTLWSFDIQDGQYPFSDLVMDKTGNLYGTTSFGGTGGSGVIFELTNSGGSWTETVLHNFGGNGDGASPVAGLLPDKSGAFYGTTEVGGANGCGTVFELTQTGGAWTESVLYSFTGNSDGCLLQSALIEDAGGSLYGTAVSGNGSGLCGGYACGTVFELSSSHGAWRETTLYQFTGQTDGGGPHAGLRWSATGELYGTTSCGGANASCKTALYKNGTVFQLSKSGRAWKETVLHSFGSGTDGSFPLDSVIFDKSGDLYGTTEYGGASGYGTVWQVTP